MVRISHKCWSADWAPVCLTWKSVFFPPYDIPSFLKVKMNNPSWALNTSAIQHAVSDYARAFLA